MLPRPPPTIRRRPWPPTSTRSWTSSASAATSGASVTACDMDIYAHFLAQPGHLRASIEWFATLPQDVKNDAIYQKTKLRIPVLAIGASANLGSREATWVRKYATNVTGVIIPNSGHW